MNIVPLRDKVVIRRLEAEERSKGGIILPDAAKQPPMKGKVLSVGPGAYDKDNGVRKMSVKEGDTVLFTRYAGDEIELDGEKVLIMNEHEILAIIK